MRNPTSTGAVSLRGGDTGWTAITTALSLGDGNGGNINITAASLELINSELLVGLYNGRGSAGNINVRVNGAISVIGDNRDGVGGVFSDVLSTGRETVGNGGNINFVADSLVLSNGGTLLSTTRGQGNAGNINLDIANKISANGIGSDGRFASGIYAGVSDRGVGNGGDIRINTGSIELSNGGMITSSTEIRDIPNSFARGNSGDIIINARDFISLDGESSNKFTSQISSRVGTTGIGNGGDININTRLLSLKNGAEVSVSKLSSHTGNAGNLDITANRINLDNASSLRAEVNAGKDGNITINTENLLMRRASSITANASNTANGGNININADALAQLEKSKITANAAQGQGGNITINTQGLFSSFDSEITASGSTDGKIKIITPDIKQENALQKQATNFVGTDTVVASSCLAVRNTAQRKFVVTGNSGLPSIPNTHLDFNTARLRENEG